MKLPPHCRLNTGRLLDAIRPHGSPSRAARVWGVAPAQLVLLLQGEMVRLDVFFRICEGAKCRASDLIIGEEQPKLRRVV